jgi:hypothetical protein
MEILEWLAKGVGAASGLAMSWAISPLSKNGQTIALIFGGFFISAVGAPLTLMLIHEHLSFKLPADGSALFICAAINGCFIAPVVKVLKNRIEKQDTKPIRRVRK